MYDFIPKQFLILDSKKKTDFKVKTFNGYKKSEIMSELEKTILSGNIEKATLWLTELHCSGYLSQIINRLLNIYFKHINRANLKLIPIIFNTYINIKTKIEKNDELSLRNDQFVRNHIHNLLCFYTFSSKYKIPKLPNIKPESFNMLNNKHILIAKNLDKINFFIKNADDKNIIIPLAEIIENINNKGISKSLENCLFWLNWLYIYEKNTKEGYISCNTRSQEDINEKFYTDYNWIIWEILLKYSDNNIYIPLLFKLYKIDFQKSKKKQKLDIIILAILIIIDPLPKIENNILIQDNYYINKTKIISNINYQYLDINNNKEKGHEIVQNTIFEKKYSPLFSKEKYSKNHSDIALNNYTSKSVKKKNKQQSIIEKKNIKKKTDEEIYNEKVNNLFYNLDNVRVNSSKKMPMKIKENLNLNNKYIKKIQFNSQENLKTYNDNIQNKEKFSINKTLDTFKI